MLRKTFTLFLYCSIMLIFGCAYFNTFYNARTAFNEAYREHELLLNENPDSFYVTPTEQMVYGYTRAIEKSAKMMDVYPDADKWHERATFLMGRALFYRGDYTFSINRMRDLEDTFPQSSYIPQSYLYRAKSHIQTGDLNSAEDLLDYLLYKYPDMNEEHQITMLMVDIALRRGGRALAISMLQEVMSGRSGGNVGILLRTAELYIDMEQYAKAQQLLLSAPRTRNVFLAYRIERALLRCYVATDELEIALEHVNAMLNNRRYYQYHYEILFEKGMVLKDLGRLEEAVALFKRITQESEELAGYAWIELAFIYQRQLGDFELATEAFQNASAVPDTAVSNQATRKYNALEAIRALRDPDPNDTTSYEQRVLKIAEIFNFELGVKDSAFSHYMELADGEWKDTSIAPRALSMAAIIARSDMADTTTSDSLLNVVIENYPQTEYARSAQQLKQVEVTVQTSGSIAQKEFKKAEELLYDKNEPIEAVKVFYGVYSRFPELDIAPKSLYMAAHVSDNVLQRNQAALTLYQTLCDSYPESEYCMQKAGPRVQIAMDTISARRELVEAARATQKQQQISEDDTPELIEVIDEFIGEDSTKTQRE
ncbi:tetratricopeptide repeat protein [Chitinispirillales bacterium ANBcel5]|uniref:tetratricopeptide repeat protein n=1 Tax=Cellulosispirillum alkaliphilum TaxID=3039283 RepID=UPI002A569184|nr:tetratricopeptide repeat protein [Chitinispirillales bacterium ANBcel5]